MIVTVEQDSYPPRVRIDTTAEAVYRTIGTETVQVRGEVVDGVIYDYELPQAVDATYSDGLATSDPVQMPNVGNWLIHPGAPDPVPVRALRGALVVDDTGSVSSILDIPGGATFAVSFPRSADRGGFRLNVAEGQEQPMRDLLADGSVLFLSTPPTLGLGPCYLSLGDAQWQRRQNWAGDLARLLDLPYVEVDRPTYVVSSTVTIGTLTGTIGSLSGTIGDLGG